MNAGSSTRARTFGLLAMSTAAHLVIFTLLGLVPPPSEVLAMQDIEIEVMEPEVKAEPPPPPPPPPEPEPKQPQARRAEPEAPPEQPEPEQAPPPEEVADFTGVTLTGGDGSWSTAVGSGAPLKGPIGKIARATEPQQAAKAAPTGPRFVPAGSLARKPQMPPGLSEMLKGNYPRVARMQGIGGRTRVMLRILPSGRLIDIKVADESPDGYGFAAACIKTLREGPPFQPGLDRTGAAVATDIPFTCDFEVDD